MGYTTRTTSLLSAGSVGRPAEGLDPRAALAAQGQEEHLVFVQIHSVIQPGA
jgi:hypothetical protein